MRHCFKRSALADSLSKSLIVVTMTVATDEIHNTVKALNSGLALVGAAVAFAGFCVGGGLLAMAYALRLRSQAKTRPEKVLDRHKSSLHCCWFRLPNTTRAISPSQSVQALSAGSACSCLP